MKLRLLVVMALVVLTTAFSACGDAAYSMRDGYYSAEAAEFDQNGWKEFVTIYVSSGRIVTVEYDAFNKSGFIKSWDIHLTRMMKAERGTYPSEYARAYTTSLINWQNASNVESVVGAEEFHESFKMLAAAAIERSAEGDKHVALVAL